MSLIFMKKHLPNLLSALTLTPAIFLLVFWIMAMSSSDIISNVGLVKLILWGLLLSFGASLSITMFVSDILKQHDKNE